MTQPLMTFEKVGSKRAGSHRGGIRQKYVISDAQRRILLERYDGKTETIDELMRYFPGVPRWCVRKWARDLGLARAKERFWSQEDIEYLEKNLHKKSLGAIAKHLGRTKTAVKLKAKRLSINKTNEGYTMRGLMLGLGMTNHHRVQYWMEQGGDIWLFTDIAIRNLVKNHPEEIDPRRADWLWLVDVLVGGLGALGGHTDKSEVSA